VNVPNLLSGPKRASDIVEQRLRKMIVSLELPPGALIGEAELMEKLGCGRTPLREALQRLSQEYLVVSIPRKGDYVQLIEAVSHIEAVAARLAVRRADGDQIEQLESIVEAATRASQSGDILEVAYLDYEFHHAVAERSANRFIIDTTARLHRLTSRFIYLAMKKGLAGWESLDEHHRIIAAIKAGDEDAAAGITQEHFVRARDRIVAAL
jgi:DNA-binding GntR family transcriptional regulator